MNTLRCAALFLLLLVASSFAAEKEAKGGDAAAMKAATELAELMNRQVVDQLVETMNQMIWPQVESILMGQPNMGAGKLDTIKAEFIHIQRGYMKEIMAEYPAIYAKHFTASELRQLIAFYKTPLGQKTMNAMPQIMAEVMPLISEQIPRLQSQILETFKKYLQDNNLTI